MSIFTQKKTLSNNNNNIGRRLSLFLFCIEIISHYRQPASKQPVSQRLFSQRVSQSVSEQLF